MGIAQEVGNLRRFILEREEDVTGISGTGVVVHGVEFPDGHVAYRWNSPIATTVLADSIKAVEILHGHDGATKVRWLDPGPAVPTPFAFSIPLPGTTEGGTSPVGDSTATGEHDLSVGGSVDPASGRVFNQNFLQDVMEWTARNFGDRQHDPLSGELSALGMAEEAAELSLAVVPQVGALLRALIKRRQGIRGTYEDWTEEIRKEMGDVLIKLVDVAYRCDINIEAAVSERWGTIRKRDWKNDKQGHGIPDSAAVSSLPIPGHPSPTLRAGTSEEW